MGKPNISASTNDALNSIEMEKWVLKGPPPPALNDDLEEISLTESDSSESEPEEETSLILMRPYPPFVGFMHPASCLHRKKMTFNEATAERLKSYNIPKAKPIDTTKDSDNRLCQQFCRIS